MAGPGMVATYRLGPTHLAALLYNFEVRSSELKPEHEAWISSTLHPWASIRNMSVLLVGLASRTGSNALNLGLSKARADAVSRQLFLKTFRMPVETVVNMGEEAARLIGIRDGNEDDRWRGVFVSVADEPQAYIPPVRSYVERRSSVVVLLKEELKAFGGGEPGERAFQAAQAVRGALELRDGIVSETKQQVDSTFQLIRITLEKTTRSDGIPVFAELEQRYMKLRYEWGPWEGGSRDVTLIKKNVLQAHGAPRDYVRTINPVMAEDWLKRPLWAYNNL